MDGYDDDDRNIDRHDDDDRRTRAARDTFGIRDDRPTVELSATERLRFEEIADSLWMLRVTGGRCASILARAWICALIALTGATLGIASLSVLPTVVPFVGFVLALIGVAEFSRHAVGSRWWRRVMELLGLEMPT